jgi:hypothetical protein
LQQQAAAGSEIAQAICRTGGSLSLSGIPVTAERQLGIIETFHALLRCTWNHSAATHVLLTLERLVSRTSLRVAKYVAAGANVRREAVTISGIERVELKYEPAIPQIRPTPERNGEHK